MKRVDGLTERVSGPQLELPRVNALVRVSIGIGLDPDGPMVAEDIASRIEDVSLRPEATSSGRLLIAAPRYAGDTELPRARSACWISWPTEKGLMDLPVAFVSAEYASEQLAAWWVEATGPAVRTERRRYFRVTLHLPLEVKLADVTVSGHTVDLSEGGLRCLLPAKLGDAQLELGSEVQVAFAPNGHASLSLTAVVARLLPGPNRQDPHEVGLRFVDPRAYGDVMRRVVYAEQLAARRRRLI